VGYDGQVYLEGIENANTLIVVQSNKGSCQVAFNAPRNTGERVIIPDAVCRSIQ
jgi:outer membrane usher protein